ncbi:leucine-rich repeat extensin-like protein 5 [Zootermopsis nevadensis]|uniref:leucine-rich repeat extensin-like protein 5 n=1 Tax=Zootermopsis nevadensis TaxID=136037 RepID=UPI000B8E8302|nr:leucine-rich repeat extensin-like protein 5 [Zootermopsis nevadensis]
MRFFATNNLFVATVTFVAITMPRQSSSLPTMRGDASYHHLVRRDVTSDYRDEDRSTMAETRNSQQYPRTDKSLAFYDYWQPPHFTGGYVPEFPFNGYAASEDANEILARTDPLDNIIRPKNPIPYPDSPIYYIRLPPTPYVFVPGMGYVSQPPPPSPLSSQVSPFINLPIDFIANGKPTNIYQWSGAPTMEPGITELNRPSLPSYPYPKPKPPAKPDSTINNLNNGPYVFNGRPSDVYVLRDSVNSLYSDALQNFYP